MKRISIHCLLIPCASLAASVQQTKRLTILHTSNTHSRIEPTDLYAADQYAGIGGVVRRTTFLKDYRAKHPDVLLFDCGDISQGTPYYNLLQDETEVKMMSLAGYDAMTTGNHEFDLGLDNMACLFRMVDFPVVCANYDVTETVLEGLVKPYVVLSRNGMKIDVFGLSLKMEGLVQADKCEGIVYNDPIVVTQKTADHLRTKEGCDVVVCPSHLGLHIKNGVCDEKLAAETKGTDVVLGGRSHTFIEKPVFFLDAEGKSIPILCTGKNGIFVGELDLTLSEEEQMKRLLLFVLIIVGFCGRFVSDAKRCPVAQVVVELIEPLLVYPVQDDMQCRLWVDSVLDRLSLKERVGQLFIYATAPHQDKSNRELLRKVIEDCKVGGLPFSGDLMQNQVVLTNEAQHMADIPLLITSGGEWGLSTRLKDTPVFLKSMVLGCIQDDSLLYEYGCKMVRQCKELGVQVNSAPVADANINPKNPVINIRSFGGDPVNVANKAIARVRGLEDGGVLSVAKHSPGHGDTDVDSRKALPVLTSTRERLDNVGLYSFKKVIGEGLGGIMMRYLEAPAFEKGPGSPSPLFRKVVYDLLMHELKFRGLVSTDTLAMKGVSNNGSLCLKALKARHDLLLVPRRIKEGVAAALAIVKRGELSEQAIEEKCHKVLTYKYVLGLNKKPTVRLLGLDMRTDTPYTRDLIRRLNAATIIVLSNPTEVLPLDPDIKDVAVLNVGTAAEMQSFIKRLSEYTHPVEFRSEKDLSGAGRKALRDRLPKYKRILVCVAE